ncbi:MAG: peptidylprolyl isomerase [Microscillaceae bacterium]|nr:peptidylprolyl isomerase [Microscillaceae bacterium]
MLTAKNGDFVKVHYTGKYPDGTVFDTSENREPLEFSLGQGQMIAGFEKAILGMEVGQQKTVNLGPEEAYGPLNPEMVFTMNRQELPDHIDAQPGLPLQAHTDSGQVVQVMVTQVQGEIITLDANHPLAGKDLVFDIQLVEITPAADAQNKPLLFD